VTVNRTDAFVDPISYVIKSAGSPIRCDDVAPPRYKVRGKWYCSYPVLKECHDPAMLPVDEVRIDPVKINNIDLGKSIYTKEQLEEFARFQDSQGTRKAYLAETAEMAYTGCNEKGEWGLALSSAAQGSLIDLLGASFFPLYRVVGPMICPVMYNPAHCGQCTHWFIFTVPQRFIFTVSQRFIFTVSQWFIFTISQWFIFTVPQCFIFAVPQRFIFTVPQWFIFTVPQWFIFTVPQWFIFTVPQWFIFAVPQWFIFTVP
jgi:hypothetical protein